MRIIARRTILQFVESRADSRDHKALKSAVDAWFAEASKAHWTGTADVKARYATASIVAANRIGFNVKGNDYRLVVSVDFEKPILCIKWIGAHRNYDTIDVKEIGHHG